MLYSIHNNEGNIAMMTILLIVCLILVYWVTKLTSQIGEQTKIHQYNLEGFQKRFEDIDKAFEFEREQREHLLSRIHDLEKEQREKFN